MEITRIGKFTSAEVDALSSAGSILGSLVKAMDAGEINEVDEETMHLIKAVADVAARAHSKTFKGQ